MKNRLVAWWLVLVVVPVGGVYDPVNHIESARLYGNIDAYAYYFVDLLIGTPPQRASVILDTGSGLTGFPCANCPHCGKHIDPNFDIAKSSTAKWMPCPSPDCRGQCTKGHCTYRQSYQEGSSISGFWFQDVVRFGDAFQGNPPINANLGCHQNENKLFYTQKANGIFGIQGSKTLLQLLFNDHAHIESKIFSICLAEWGGAMTVGGHNESYHKSPVQYVKLVGTRYGVGLTEMRVNGQKISGFRNTVIDSGTTYTYMSSSSYKSLKSLIEQHCDRNSNCGKRTHNCYKVPGLNNGLNNFPGVEVVMDGVVTLWEPRAYMYRKGNSDNYCYGFENDGASAPTVLGASWMLYKEVIFDLRNNKVGFATAECPSYKDRPKHDPNAVVPTVTVAPKAAAVTTVTVAPAPPLQQQAPPPPPPSPPVQPASATVVPVAKKQEPPAKVPTTTAAAFAWPTTHAGSGWVVTSTPQLPYVAQTLPMFQKQMGPAGLAAIFAGGVVCLFTVACCIMRWMSRKSASYQQAATSPSSVPKSLSQGVPSSVVGSTFEIGDDVDEEDQLTFSPPRPLE